MHKSTPMHATLHTQAPSKRVRALSLRCLHMRTPLRMRKRVCHIFVCGLHVHATPARALAWRCPHMHHALLHMHHLCALASWTACMCTYPCTHTPTLSLSQVAPATPEGAPASAVCWDVALKEPLAAGEVASVDAFTVYADVQQPYPKEIEQGEPQLVLLTENVYSLSPYHVSSQYTEVCVVVGEGG